MNNDQFLIKDNIVQAEFSKTQCEPEADDMNMLEADSAAMFAGMEQVMSRFDELDVMVKEHSKSISEVFLKVLDNQKAAESGSRYLRDRIKHTEVNLANMANALKSFGSNAITFHASQSKGLSD